MNQQSSNYKKDMSYLDWVDEKVDGDTRYCRWNQPASNICLDFHGDPAKAKLVVFSDGNHHMALLDCLDLFSRKNKELSGVFYATTPPAPIVELLKNGGLQMGNLVISVSPHVFISPPEILDNLVAERFISDHTPFIKNQGNVLLVKKGNPKSILKISDLIRADIQLFLSNPDTEKASFMAYSNTLKAMASETAFPGFLEEKIKRGEVLFGKCIHHREAPQAVAAGAADVAVVFFHLALRYLRIFPDLFDIVPLGGSVEKPDPHPGNVVGKTHIAMVGDGGPWGRSFISFLVSKQALEIYEHHGLRSVANGSQNLTR